MEDITMSPGLSKLFTDVEQPTQQRQAPTPPIPEPTETEKEVEEKLPIDKKLVESSTEIAMALIDGVQNTTLKIWASARRNNRANEITDSTTGYAKMANIVSQTKNKNFDLYNLTNEEAQLLELNNKVEEFINDLPFSDKENQRLSVPLKYIIEKNGGSIPLELAFILGLATCIGGRIGDIYSL